MKRRLLAQLLGMGTPPHMALRGLRFPEGQYEAIAREFERTVDLSSALALAPDVFDAVWLRATRLGQQQKRIDLVLFDLVRYERVTTGHWRGTVRGIIAGVWLLRRAGCEWDEALEVSAIAQGCDGEAVARARTALAERGLSAAVGELARDDLSVLAALGVAEAPLDGHRASTMLLEFLVDEFEREAPLGRDVSGEPAD